MGLSSLRFQMGGLEGRGERVGCVIADVGQRISIRTCPHGCACVHAGSPYPCPMHRLEYMAQAQRNTHMYTRTCLHMLAQTHKRTCTPAPHPFQTHAHTRSSGQQEAHRYTCARVCTHVYMGQQSAATSSHIVKNPGLASEHRCMHEPSDPDSSRLVMGTK